MFTAIPILPDMKERERERGRERERERENVCVRLGGRGRDCKGREARLKINNGLKQLQLK